MSLFDDIPALETLDNSEWIAEDKKGSGKTVRSGAWRYSPAVVEMVAEMLGRRYRKTDIHRFLYIQAGKDLNKRNGEGNFYHKPSMAVVNKIISEARGVVKSQLDIEIAETKGTAITFYESIIRSNDCTPTELIRAQERIDAIIGHDAKYRTNAESVESVAKKMREAILEMERSMGVTDV